MAEEKGGTLSVQRKRPLTAAEHHALAGAIYASELFPQLPGKLAALVRAQAGEAFGLGPVASQFAFHVIPKKGIAMTAALMSALVKHSERYDFEIAEWTDERCLIRFYEKNKRTGEWQEAGPPAVFTIAEAKQAELLGKDNWKHYRRAMLAWRALALGCRLYCSEVFMFPVYTYDELDADDEARNEQEALGPDAIPDAEFEARPAANEETTG